MKLLVDIQGGHKTGYYLDQRDSRLATRQYVANKRVLNCFSYTGGFAVSALMGACRGYKDINMLAIQLLNPGGILLTFSCSGLMTTDLFQKLIADAAVDAGRDVQFIEQFRQAADHPVIATYPVSYTHLTLPTKRIV